jgi:hypothetical protein
VAAMVPRVEKSGLKDGERDEVLKGVGVQILALHYWLGRAVRCGFRADTFVCRES